MAESLYRKWRSRGFFEVVGQDHVTQTLRNAVRTGSVGHAYLFTGPRGTGKTSTARILARAVNCLDPQDGEPCNRCEPCQSMLANRCLDVIEIDAASNNSVDNVRDLREKVNFSPAEVRRKVYIIDEVHMLSTAAFNALLKTLEEPPAHVLFVLATTDVHKVPATITSRCQRLDFRIIAPRDITARLAYVCAQEGMEVDVAALELLAQHATGSLRDALSLLDQVRAYEGATIGVREVEDALGLARRETLADLTAAIVAGDVGAALALINDLAVAGADMRQYVKQLMQYWRDLLLLCAGGMGALGYTPDERMAGLARGLSMDGVTAMLKALLQPDYSGRRSASAQWQLELAVVDACRPFVGAEGHTPSRSAVPVVPADSTATAPPAPQRREVPAAPDRESAPSSPGVEGADVGQSAPRAALSESSAPVPRADTRESPPVSPPGEEAPSLEPEAATAGTATAHSGADDEVAAGRGGKRAETSRAAVDGHRPPAEIWALVQQALAREGNDRLNAMLKTSCTPVKLDGDVFVVHTRTAFEKERVEAPKSRTAIEGALAGVLGRAVSLRCVTIGGASATGGGSATPPSETFTDLVARDLRAVHMERKTF